MLKRLKTYLTDPTMPWGTFLLALMVGLVTSVLLGLLLRSLPKQPGQGATQQCPCQCATHADERGLVGLARGGLGLAVKQPQLPLLAGPQPLRAASHVVALPCGQFVIAQAAYGSQINLLELAAVRRELPLAVVTPESFTYHIYRLAHSAPR